MSNLTHINLPIELFTLPLKGRYEMSIVALAYNFGSKGLRLSNGKLAKAMKTSSRTIERVIARLRRIGIIEDADRGKNNRCLRLTTDTMSVVATGITSGTDTDTMSGEIPTLGVASTDMTADHNKELSNNKGSNCPTSRDSSDEFMTFWNHHENLPRIRKLTNQRKRFLNSRIKEPEFAENWRLIINKLSRSAFHTGQNKNRWKATVDWLLKDGNYVKILELEDPQAGAEALEPLETRDVTEEEAEALMQEVEV